MLNYLDRVQEKIAALPFAEEVKQAAVRQEGLRRRPQALQGEGTQPAALRGVLLMCAVVLSKAGDEGLQAVAAVKDIFRRAYRASSLVECINSVLRMHQAGHRRMTQELFLGPQTPVLELPHIRRWSPPPNNAIRATGSAVAPR